MQSTQALARARERSSSSTKLRRKMAAHDGLVAVFFLCWAQQSPSYAEVLVVASSPFWVAARCGQKLGTGRLGSLVPGWAMGEMHWRERERESWRRSKHSELLLIGEEQRSRRVGSNQDRAALLARRDTHRRRDSRTKRGLQKKEKERRQV